MQVPNQAPYMGGASWGPPALSEVGPLLLTLHGGGCPVSQVIRARLGFKQGPPGPPMEHKGSNSEIPHFWVYCLKSAK